MKYIRVVLAVDETKDLQDYVPGLESLGGLTFRERLDVFIETDDAVQGAYVSAEYDTRDEAIDPDSWKEQQF